MPQYQNAIGYLDALVTEVNQPWFSILRELVVSKNVATLEPQILDKVCLFVLNETSQVPLASLPVRETSASQQPMIANYLERLSEFSNFKLPGDTLIISRGFKGV